MAGGLCNAPGGGRLAEVGTDSLQQARFRFGKVIPPEISGNPQS